MYFLEAKNPYFATNHCSKPSYISAFVSSTIDFIDFTQYRTIDFTNIFITQEWLVVESYPIPC